MKALLKQLWVRHHTAFTAWYFAVGFFLLPFIVLPWLPVGYEVPRVWFFWRWSEGLTLLAAGELLGRGNVWRVRSVLKLLLLFGGIALIASIMGADPVKSLIGNAYRADGLVTLMHLLAFAFSVAIVWKDRYLVPVAFSAAISVTVLSLWALCEWVILNSRQAGSRIVPVGVSFGQSKFFGGYLVVAVSVASRLWLEKSRASRAFTVVVVVAASLAIAASQAVGAVISAGLLLALWGILSGGKTARRISVISFVALFLLVAVFVGIRYGTGRLPYNINAEGRDRIFMKLALATLKRPLLGWGQANVDYAFSAVDWPYRFERDVYVDKAHSTILETLVTTGIAGLFCYILLIVTSLRILFRSSRDGRVLAAGLLVVVFHSQTNVTSIAEEVFFWLLVGIAAKHESRIIPLKPIGKSSV